MNVAVIGSCLFMLMFLKSYLPLTEQLYGSTVKICCLSISEAAHVSTLLWLHQGWCRGSSPRGLGEMSCRRTRAIPSLSEHKLLVPTRQSEGTVTTAELLGLSKHASFPCQCVRPRCSLLVAETLVFPKATFALP